MDKEITIQEIKDKIREFNTARDWEKYHNPNDLILALVEKLGEPSRVFKWVKSSNELKYLQKSEVKEEIADLFIYLINLSNKTGIDISSEIFRKLEVNNRKYCGEKFKKEVYDAQKDV